LAADDGCGLAIVEFRSAVGKKPAVIIGVMRNLVNIPAMPAGLFSLQDPNRQWGYPARILT
jgi:hypothetical protein